MYPAVKEVIPGDNYILKRCKDSKPAQHRINS